MAVIGIRTGKSLDARIFWDKTEERLSRADLGKNPFESKVLRLDSETTILSIKPVYPMYFLFGFLPLIFGIVFGFIAVAVLGLAVLSVGLLWTSFFFYIVILIGLKKQGYKGKVSFISKNKIIEELMMYGAN